MPQPQNRQSYKVLPGSQVTVTVVIGNGNPGSSLITPGNIPPGAILNVSLGLGSVLVNTSIDIGTIVNLLNSDRGVVSYQFSGGASGPKTFSPLNPSTPVGNSSVYFEEGFQFVS